MVTQDDTAPMGDRDEAVAQLIRKAESGDPDAQYLVGRLYRDGPVLIPDSVEAQYWFDQAAWQGMVAAQYALGKLYLERGDKAEAHYWFTQSAARGNEYAQFFLDHWNNLKPPSIMLSVSRLLHHIGRIFQEQMPTPTIPGGVQIDRKRLAQLREKKIAMGHKPDDHEEHNRPSISM